MATALTCGLLLPYLDKHIHKGIKPFLIMGIYYLSSFRIDANERQQSMYHMYADIRTAIAKSKGIDIREIFEETIKRLDIILSSRLGITICILFFIIADRRKRRVLVK